MTERRDGTSSSRNELQDDSAATGFAAVERALSNRPRGTPDAARPALVADRLVARGDIRVIEPLPWLDGRRRLAVVRRVHADHDSADVMLAHAWSELATDTDAVIPGTDSGLSYPLVVECYVRGPVWLLQVRQRVGDLDERMLEAIGHAVVDGDPAVEGAQTGLPLAGPADPRWRFKEDESAELRALTRDCATALLDDGQPWLVEPDRLSPATHGAAEAGPDPTAAFQNNQSLEATVHLLATRSVAVDFRSLDPATLVPERWIEHLGRDVGLSMFAALQPTLQRQLSHLCSNLLQDAA